MIATGNHLDLDSLREAPPLVYPPAASPQALEHLNLDPVQAENVPIFCLKLDMEHIGRAARAAAAAKSKAIRLKFSVVKMLYGCQVRAGWILKEGGSDCGSKPFSASLS